MNIQVLKPWSRLSTQNNARVTSLRCSGNKVYLGLSNGDLLVMSINSQTETPGSEPNSIRSFRSFTDAKHMFTDNKHANSLVVEKTFLAVFKLAITAIDIIPLFPENGNRVVLLLSTDDQIQVYEWVGAHLNLVKTLEEARGSSARSYVKVGDSRYLLVGLRKKVFLYKIEQRTRNIYDFVLAASHLFRDRVKEICAYGKEELAIVATGHGYHLLELGGTYSVRELPKDFANVGAFVQPSSFTYFGLSSTGPAIRIVPCGNDRSIIVNDLQTAMLRPSDGFHRLEESAVVLPTAPVAVNYLYPCYMIVTYPKTLEIIDIDSGCRIQEFKHLLNSYQISVSVSDGSVVIGAGSMVYHFSILPSQKQLDQYLSSSDPNLNSQKELSADARAFGIDRAITYVISLADDDPYLQDKANASALTAKTRQLFLRDLQKEKAVLYFERYSRYAEALVDIASEWAISLTDILPLFPEFLNGSTHKISGTSRLTSARKGSIKNVTIEDLELFKLLEKLRPSSDGSSKDPNAAKKAAASRFSKAVNNFIVYLTDQRRIHYSLLSSPNSVQSIKWKGVELNALDIYPGLDPSKVQNMLTSCIITIDTTLFLCYFYIKPMLLGPLLRLPNNKCNAKVVNECLLKKIHAHDEELEGSLSQLLDFYFGRELHDDALAMLKVLAHDLEEYEDKGFENLLRGPILTIRYMQKLTNEHLDLVFKYSHWILEENSESLVAQAELIFMNESYECESYDNFKVFEFLKGFSKSDALPIRYLEWLLYDTDILESSSRKKHTLKLTTKLSLFYLRHLKLLNSSGDSFYQSDWYKKLHKLLESNREFEPWTILKNIPTSEDKYLRFSIFIYKRLGEHQKSVDILYNQLADLHGAMEYCAEVYELQGGKTAGTDLLQKLLEDLLIHYEENQDDIVTLLLAQGHRMSTLNILAALPNTFPLHKLSLYLEFTTQAKQNELYVARMAGQLNKVGASKLKHQLLRAQQGYCTVTSRNEVCQICGKSLSSGMLCAGHNHHAVHYGCGMKSEAA